MYAAAIWARTHPPDADPGFTLIETLVALVVLSIALSSFYTMISISSRASSLVSLHQTAIALARSHLDAIGRETAVEPGSWSGAYKNGLRWQLSIEALAPNASDTATRPYRIQLETFDPRGRPLLRLDTIKLAAPAS